MLVELFPRDSRLDDAIEIFGVNRNDAIHVAEIEADAAARRVDLAFQRSSGAEADDRHALIRAQTHDLLHLFGRLRKHHRIRRLIGNPGERVAVLLAHRLRSDKPVADFGCERDNDAIDRVAVALEPLPGFDDDHAIDLTFRQSGGHGRSGQVGWWSGFDIRYPP